MNESRDTSLDAQVTPLSTPVATFVVVLALAHVVSAWLLRTPGVGWGEDDVAYLLLAQELRHFSYREVQDVLAPVHARFPPVFPLLLALVGALCNDNLDVLLGFVAVCSGASILLLFSAARRMVGEQIALASSVLYAVNPNTLWDAGNLMAEAPFKLFVFLGLWALTREREGTRFAVLAGAAICLAALTRTAGVVFVAALFLYWVLTRQFQRAIVFSMVAAVTVGGWLYFTFNAPDPENRRLYVSDLQAVQRRSRGGFVTVFLRRLVPRGQRLATSMVPFVLSLPTVAHTVVDNALWLAVWLGGLVTGLVVLVRRWLAVALFMSAYVGLLFLWRYALERFVTPILPLALIAILVGVSWWASRIVPRVQRGVLWAIVGLMSLGVVPRIRAQAERISACDRDRPAESTACWPRAEREYMRLAHWARDSTPPDALFFVSKERGFYHHSGRLTINQDRGLREPDDSLGVFLRARGVSFTVVTPVGVRADQHNSLLARACRDLAVVRRESAQTMLLRVRGEAERHQHGDACAALRPWGAGRPTRE